MATIPRQEKLLRRSRTDRILGGVCGGLARYLGVDTVLVRLFFVLFAILAGSGLLVYVLLWILMPVEDGETAPGGRN